MEVLFTPGTVFGHRSHTPLPTRLQWWLALQPQMVRHPRAPDIAANQIPACIKFISVSSVNQVTHLADVDALACANI